LSWMIDAVRNARVKCTLRLEFENSESAKKVHSAVELDNEGYLKSRVDGPFIHAEIEAESLKSLLHTLDDFLSCTAVAEKMMGNKD